MLLRGTPIQERETFRATQRRGERAGCPTGPDAPEVGPAGSAGGTAPTQPKDQRQLVALGDPPEVGVQTLLAGPVVGGGDDQGPVGAGPAANRVRRTASAVALDPVPARTRARPAACSTTTAISRRCSSWVSVGDSPVSRPG